MPPLSSNLGLCSSCYEVLAEIFLSPTGETISRSQQDFLAAQSQCHICKWLAYILGPDVMSKLPERLSTTFRFDFIGNSQNHRNDKYEDLVLRVIMVGESSHSQHRLHCAMWLISSKDTETTSYPPPTEPRFHASQLSILASKWAKNCQQNHGHCQSGDRDFRPKRLIQIVDLDHLKLVLPRDLPLEVQMDYVALSHCWGGGSPLTLTKTNEGEYQRHIPMNDLPTTFQEAMLACSELGFSYIWIDSLCIIQEFDEQADWKEQAAEMDSVYGNAALNLCMAGSANPSEPSFGSRDTDLILPVCISLTAFDGDLVELRLVPDSTFECDIKDSPLRKRGWVFQEWYLAKRSLIFARMQLWWHCREMLACETFPHGTEGTIYEWCLGDVKSMKDIAYGTETSPSFSQSLWWRLIKQYAGTRLTKEAKDRVIAFSGMSKAFGQTHQMQDEYMAGMWRCNLPQALLWYRFCGGKTSRSDDYKAPSWSWMSLDGPFYLGDHSQRKGFSQEPPVITNRQCGTANDLELFLADERNPTGMLQGGTITIHGHLVILKKGRDGDIDMNNISVSGLKYGEIRMDEEDDEGNVVISYLDRSVTSPQGVMTRCSRTRISSKAATGSIFVLPLLRQTYTWSKDSDTATAGLILYKPPDQQGVFYRIGSFRAASLGSSDFLEFTKSLEAEYPKTFVRIL
ncbi:heterokaryon incompatibility protein-domain-containing protein [Fusarium avenaceum]|nr:heterokaryon incompatibility protein-domain-containing protein [Fusarium avenaceum]